MPSIRSALIALMSLSFLLPARAAGTPPTAPRLETVWTSLLVGQQGQYAARGVTDPDAGTTITYTFDWGDGTTTSVGPTTQFGGSTGVGPYHAWLAAGTYSVRARATDNQGNVSPWSNVVAVTVSVATFTTPPTAPNLASVWSSLKAGQTGQYLARDVVDPDLGTTIIYEFDWNDGTTSTVGPTTVFGVGRGVTASHAWAAEGVYAVRARAVDNGGNASPWSATFAVTVTPNSAPSVPAPPSGPSTWYAGMAASFSASATDPDGNPVYYTFSWGDGTQSNSGFVGSGMSGSASHTWTATSDYWVQVKATDNLGLSSAWSSPVRIRVVVNTPPTTPAVPSGPKILGGGVMGTYSTAGSLDSTSSSIRYTFDFGDGGTYASAWVAPGAPVGVSHMWSLPGTYAVRVKATDDGGLSSAWSAPFTVTITSKSIKPGGGPIEAP